jgi:histidinol dehydrogenase
MIDERIYPMKRFNYANPKDKKALLKILSPKYLRDLKTEKLVADILEDIANNGDEAVVRYTAKFDKAVLKPSQMRVTEKEIQDALKTVDKKFIKTAKTAIKNITEYHKFQARKSRSYKRADGTMLTQRVRPLKRVGVYVPGGAAPLASSFLMCTVPAKVAGVPEIVVATPPGPDGKINPHILACAGLMGVKEVYKVGGVQAVGALAFGTKIINKVDKIVGAGNRFVVEAKRQVFGLVDIEMIPGPSEILVLADDSANPAWVAADLLSQAEHTGNERVFLVTTSAKLADAVEAELSKQVVQLSRCDAASNSLKNGGHIILTSTMNEAVEVSDLVAPEHLEVMTREARKVSEKVTCAGAIFVGPWTPEPIGDYTAGTNHILPTGGTARIFSGLNYDEFIKKTNVVELTEKAFDKLADATITFAEVEKLTAHGQSVRVRLKGKK